MQATPQRAGAHLCSFTGSSVGGLARKPGPDPKGRQDGLLWEEQARGAGGRPRGPCGCSPGIFKADLPFAQRVERILCPADNTGRARVVSLVCKVLSLPLHTCQCVLNVTSLPVSPGLPLCLQFLEDELLEVSSSPQTLCVFLSEV